MFKNRNLNLPNFGAINSLRQIPGIFDGVFDPDLTRANAYAAKIASLFYNSDPNITSYQSLRYIQLKNRDIRRLLTFGPNIQNCLLCIASVNCYGFVREEALRQLLERSNPRAFPFILFRLADWVPQVQAVAEKGIVSFTRRMEPGQILQYYKLIDWLLLVGRVDLRKVHAEICDKLVGERNLAVITEGYENYSDGERLFISKLVISRNMVSSPVFNKLLTDNNYLIRYAAIRAIELEAQDELLVKYLDDKSFKIRRYAIRKIDRKDIERFRARIERRLFDPMFEIRAIARELLGGGEMTRFTDLYREKVRRTPDVGSIVGLSEVGTKADLELLKGQLSADRAKCRAAALYAIANLDFTSAKEIAFDMIKDPSNVVIKMCCQVISSGKNASDLDKLRMLYDQSSGSTKRILLKAINQYGGWGIAGDLLKGLAEEDVALRETAKGLLRKWFDYSSRLGTIQCKEEIEYVMGMYQKLELKSERVGSGMEKILSRIPFIFVRK